MAGIGFRDVDGVRLIISPLLEEAGMVHAFGTSDLGRTNAGAHTRLKRRFEEIKEIITVRQSHGKKAARVRRKGMVTKFRGTSADVIVTAVPGVAAAIRTADCTPLLIADPQKRVVAAVHAGWKGTAVRAGGEAVRIMAEEYGCRPSRMAAGIGPCIGPCHYQVDEPVIRAVEKSFGKRAKKVLSPDGPGKARLDLSLANRIILEESGIPRDRIWEARACTYCQEDEFFSYRREGAGVPSLYHFIVLSPR